MHVITDNPSGKHPPAIVPVWLFTQTNRYLVDSPLEE